MPSASNSARSDDPRHGVWPQTTKREPRKEAAKAALKRHLDGPDGETLGFATDDDALEALVVSLVASGQEDKQERQQGATIIVPVNGPTPISRGGMC